MSEQADLECFDPYEDVPSCPTCGAVVRKLSLESDSTSYHKIITCRIQWVCDEAATSESLLHPNASEKNFPNRMLTLRGIFSRNFKVQGNCNNAVEVVRRLREGKAK